MTKERKTRNFDFLKNPQPELPSREEVIQKTVELTGQALVNPTSTPSVSAEIETKIEVPQPVKPKTVRKKESTAPKTNEKRPKQAIMAESASQEKPKVGRRALEDARKPFTSTITAENKRRLRQLCAEHDIAMSDALNELLSAQFEKREPKF